MGGNTGKKQRQAGKNKREEKQACIHSRTFVACAIDSRTIKSEVDSRMQMQIAQMPSLSRMPPQGLFPMAGADLGSVSPAWNSQPTQQPRIFIKSGGV